MATVIFMSSCEWLFPSKAKGDAAKIEGDWKLDSIDLANDSSGKTSLLALSIGMFGKHQSDSAELVCSFDKGSVIANLSGKLLDSATYVFEGDKIKITSDSTSEVLAFSFLSDSTFSMTDKDSTVVVYKRMK